MKRLLPSPVLSCALFGLWLLLSQSVSVGTVLLGVAQALAWPVLTAELRPAPVRMRRPVAIARLVLNVAVDVVLSNFAVARAILTKRVKDIPSGFVHVPLEVRDPNALAVLAMIVAATPGTVWAELSLDRSVLLLHVLEVPDKAVVIETIKRRYERHLREIFE
ncbi:Na+/H+ antiporter subunit E [Pyxidicoccus xibeiensis]|uniref:Na+/H+ antiporter subunit E n=1 Tax=Pyxidicoccus xibeiensis TaxID=2906759 RepID=UPI0020A71E34|nr:Na+/H+ antiporter subunit E [Pyxidicoccus xibeiensis]MCP3138818.1 Na+/H+ antiporter subunit E [Pyxidicoccus xibeiensis]